MQILVTGFSPFLSETINPSEQLALELTKVDQIESLILPVEFKKSFEILKEHVERSSPDFIVMLGQASGRAQVCLEKIGLNWIQSEIADESGFTPDAGKIISEVDLALMTKFPVEQVFLDLRKKLFPVEISFSAGTFVCNELYFRVLNKFSHLKCIFVHLPLLPEQLKKNDERPSLLFDMQLEIIRNIIFLIKSYKIS